MMSLYVYELLENGDFKSLTQRKHTNGYSINALHFDQNTFYVAVDHGEDEYPDDAEVCDLNCHIDEFMGFYQIDSEYGRSYFTLEGGEFHPVTVLPTKEQVASIVEKKILESLDGECLSRIFLRKGVDGIVEAFEKLVKQSCERV